MKTGNSLSADGAVIYTRVSTKEQVDNFSLATQEKACREYCEANELRIDRVYVEQGESAKTTDRTEFQKMLAHCLANKDAIRMVIVYDISRFSRNTADYLATRKLLAAAGISIFSLRQPYGNDPEGEMMSTITASMAQYDNQRRARYNLGMMRGSFLSGNWPFIPPLGYVQGEKKVGPALLQDSSKAPLIRTAFELVATGRYSLNEALREVTARGLRTKKGKVVSPQTFNKLLRNSIYVGLMRVSKWDDLQPVIGRFAPIVDRETFDRVQLILSGKSPAAKTHKWSNEDFPLKRFLRCGTCGTPYTGSWSKGRKKRYAYYRCRSCKKTDIRKEIIEEQFVNFLKQLTPKKGVLDLFEAVVLDALKEKHKEREKRAVQLEREIIRLEAAKGRFETAFVVDRSITKETYDRQVGLLEAELLAKKRAVHEMDSTS